MGDLASLIEHAIPEGRQSLENSYANLERVAAYCEANYIQASDKHAALEDTKRFTVQSLASVAYQINTLASNLLQMLDLQTERIGDMESQLNNISQIVDIHKEKVARREIGVLTANKTVSRQHKLVAPAQQEKAQRYTRRPIDYSVLDELGHGVKITAPNNPRLIARTGSTVSAGSSGSIGTTITSTIPSDSFPVYLTSGSKMGTLPRTAAKEYRTPITIAPPTAPAMQGPEYVQQRYPGLIQTSQSGQKRSNSVTSSNYSSVNVPKHGLSHVDNYSGSLSRHSSNVPPPPPPMSVGYPVAMVTPLPHPHRGSVDEHLPPPPQDEFVYADEHSPPLPPPPMDYVDESAAGSRFNQDSSNVWIPTNYLEKVVALYDYEAEKQDELSFYENSIIYVLKKNEDGWYEGVLDGVTGLFPGNYVEPCL